MQRRPNYLLVSNCQLDDDEKWSCVKHEFFFRVLENRPACLFTNSDHSFDWCNTKDLGSVLKKESTETCSGKTYILPKNRWTKDELKEVSSLWQLDVEDIWMRPDLDANAAVEMTAEDADIFWKFYLSKLHTGDFDLIDGNIETIGGIGDGEIIVWSNPVSPEKLDSVLADLKRLAVELEVKTEDV